MANNKNKRSLRFTEEELQNMLKNSSVKIHLDNINDKSPVNKQLLLNTEKNETDDNEKVNIKKTKVVDFTAIVKSIQNSHVNFIYDENSLIIIFNDCRVLSLNQMMSYLQKKPQPFQMMQYKKIWHEKMKEVLQNIIIDSLEKQNKLPDFSSSVKMILYRQSQRLIDEDSISASFKYIIDGLRNKQTINNIDYNILKDDNQFFVSSIMPIQVKNKRNVIAIKIIIDKKPKNISSLEEFIASE